MSVPKENRAAIESNAKTVSDTTDKEKKSKSAKEDDESSILDKIVDVFRPKNGENDEK